MLTLLEYASNETCSSALAGTTVTGKQYKDLILSDFLLQRYNTNNNINNNNNNNTNNISYYSIIWIHHIFLSFPVATGT